MEAAVTAGHPVTFAATPTGRKLRAIQMRVLVINLDRSPERLTATLEELARVGLSGERIPAVDGRLLPVDAEGNISGFKRRGRAKEAYYRGTAGCWLSHQRALREAIRGNQWPCMIVEDDITIEGDDPIILPDVSNDIVYLGGLDHLPKGVYGCHAIVYRTPQAAYRVLMYHESHPTSVDSNMIRLSRYHHYHYERPYRILQKDGISQISDAFVRRLPSRTLTLK